MANADEEDRKHRAAREYLASSPLLDVMVRAALRSAGHYPPEIQQRMEASRPWLARSGLIRSSLTCSSNTSRRKKSNRRPVGRPHP